MRLFFPLSGDDVFISYSRRDGSLYAAGLADELTQKKLSCFIDKLGTEPNEDLPESLKKKIRNCTVFVIIGTEKATQSKFVEKEIVEFKKTGRTFLPIDFDGNVGKAVWYHQIPGLSSEIEKDLHTLETGDPSENVVNFVEKSFNYTRRNQYMFRMFWGALGLFLILMGLGVGAFVFAQTQITVANNAKQEADAQTKKANDATDLANQKEAEAIQKKKEAEEANQAAENARTEAKKASKLAEEKTELANEKTKIADEATDRAEKETRKAEQAKIEAQEAQEKEKIATAEANKQQKISNSQQLANKSQQLLKGQTWALAESISYAVDSAKIMNSLEMSSIESNGALRESLSLLPFIHRSHSYENDFAKDAVLSPNAQYLSILTDNGTLKIYSTADDKLIKDVPAELMPAEANTIAVTNDGRFAAVTSTKTVRLFDVETASVLRDFPVTGEDDSIGGMALSPDGKYLALLLDNSEREGMVRTIGFWETGGQQKEMIILGENLNMPMNSVAFSPDGKSFAVGGRRFTSQGYNGLAVFWTVPQPDAGKIITKEDFSQPEYVRQKNEIEEIAIGGNNTYATVSEEFTTVWKSNDSLGVATPIVRMPRIASLQNIAFSSDGKKLSVMSGVSMRDSDNLTQSKLEVWDAVGFSYLSQAILFSKIEAIAFRPDSNSVISNISYGDSETGNLQTQVWQADTGLENKSAGIHYEQKIFQSKDLRFLIGTDTEELLIWDMWNSTKTPIKLDAPKKMSSQPAATATADGSFAAVTAYDETEGNIALIYQLIGNIYVLKQSVPLKDELKSLELTIDGKRLFILNNDLTIQILDVLNKKDITPKTLKTLEGVESVTLSPKGGYLVTNLSDKALIWDNDKGEIVTWRNEKGDNIKELTRADNYCFSSQDRYLTSCVASEINLLDLDKKISFLLKTDSIKDDSSLNAVAFSEDEKYFAAGSYLGNTSVFEIGSRTATSRLQYDGIIKAIAFNRRNTYIAVAVEEPNYYDMREDANVLRISLLQPQDLINEAARRLGTFK